MDYAAFLDPFIFLKNCRIQFSDDPDFQKCCSTVLSRAHLFCVGVPCCVVVKNWVLVETAGVCGVLTEDWVNTCTVLPG